MSRTDLDAVTGGDQFEDLRVREFGLMILSGLT